MAKSNKINNNPEAGTTESPISWKRAILSEAKRRLKLIGILFVAILICVAASFLILRNATKDDGPAEPDGVLNGYNYVDLGLTVKWATENVGANEENPTGALYAWGQIESNESFSQETYIPVDKKTLYIKRKANHDAATVVMGKGWYIPTDKEINELINNCTWERIANDTLNGYRVTGTNGNSIFMPIDATSHYWSSHVFKEDRAQAYALSLGDSAVVTPRTVYDGYYIRAVTR